MKRWISCLMLMLGFVGGSSAQLPEAVRLFDAGNTLYQAGNYQSALATYEEALAHGYGSADLYYNIGNAYYRLDQIGQAIRYYEKARRLAPDHRELLHNLSIARSRTLDQFSQLPTPFWRVWWNHFIGLFGIPVLFWMGLGLYLLATGFLVYRIWTRTRSPWNRRGLAISAVLGLLLLLAAFTASLEAQNTREAVVIVERVSLHEAPLQDATIALDIHAGLLLDVLQKQDTWLEVRLPNGVTGWVPATSVGEV